jgi:hypothetical protein
MNIYILISVVVLIIVALLIFFVRGAPREKTLTPLASLAFGFILAGIIFGENRLIGYSLMGVGVILSIIDMVRKLRTR